MKRFISQIVRSGSPILVFSVLALTSCGGGGGGGGGDAVGGDRFGVRVLQSNSTNCYQQKQHSQNAHQHHSSKSDGSNSIVYSAPMKFPSSIC